MGKRTRSRDEKRRNIFFPQNEQGWKEMWAFVHKNWKAVKLMVDENVPTPDGKHSSTKRYRVRYNPLLVKE